MSGEEFDSPANMRVQKQKNAQGKINSFISGKL